MAMMNAYAQYNNSKILTASPAELVLMLYEGAIKFGNIAILAIENRDIQKAHTNIIKVQRIVDNFRATLDMKYPVAQDFDRVYAYLQERIIDANVHKDAAVVEEIVTHLRTMRDTWKEVMKQAR
ncbi:MAG: flagellar export chaperone FliS [Lachnospiraceae bacterium]|nr:flagellar export chaperone FliS [Lachnospiraceae bacterium]